MKGRDYILLICVIISSVLAIYLVLDLELIKPKGLWLTIVWLLANRQCGRITYRIFRKAGWFLYSIYNQPLIQDKKSFLKAQAFICEKCKEFRDTFSNFCEICENEYSIRKSNDSDYEQYIKKRIAEEIIAIGSYCNNLLNKLKISNSPKVIKDINELIIVLLKKTEKYELYSYLAEAKMAQAKLSLCQLNFDKATTLLTKAQRLAELHGLPGLAIRISDVHDKILDSLTIWESFNIDTPMLTRLKLSSFDRVIATEGVIERILGKLKVEILPIVEEKPLMLLIMDNDGNTYFKYSFTKDWVYDDLFSSFMAAFNTFSSEIFSKSIDRIKIDENLIIINPISPFLVCYVIEGKSYSALKKVIYFSDLIRNTSEIWGSLQKSVITSEMLEINNPPSLGIALNKIFLT
ncbi:MAG: hypothetical protein ACFE8N_09925 [Promethearchaeota archaeon]